MAQDQNFEEAGEEVVRRNLALGHYGEVNGKRAKAWLSRIDRQRDSERELLRVDQANEQLEIARSAKDAAWKSAQASENAAAEAQKANLIATVAMIVSVIAIAVAVVSAFLE